MTPDPLSGHYVRLAICDFEKDLSSMAAWNHDSLYTRLANGEPATLWSGKQIKDWIEKNIAEESIFNIRTLADDQLIGTIDLSGFDWVSRSAWVGIGIGDREYWGKGYGTEAMQLILKHGFTQLNLNRVNLTVFEYNPRAIHSYEKVGFRHEGRLRQWMVREGKRYDLIYMGILRDEWLALQAENASLE